MSRLAVKEMVAGYGKLAILQNVTVKVRDKEIVSVLGPNGSGKSTLLKTVMGLTRVFSGSVVLDGHDITRLPPFKRVAMGLGYVPQRENIFPRLTVEENLELGGYLVRDGLDDALEETYSVFPVLKEKRRRKAYTLSGGERQMLAIARALVARPRILLLDEPSAMLAPAIVEQVFRKIEEIRENGTTILLVEQHAEKALEVSDRTYFLSAGRVVFEGASSEIGDVSRLAELYMEKIGL